MKKIDANVFLNKFLKKDYTGYDEKIGCKPIDDGLVNEFKIGKKFAYSINKANPNSMALLDIHSRLNVDFLKNVPLNRSAKAFVAGTSYLDFLEPHRVNFCFLRVDLKNFFHSISKKLIRDVFESYFEDEVINNSSNQKLVDAFVNIVSLDLSDKYKNESFIGESILPMGFKTSPMISNIIFRKLDFILEEFCFKNSITYTRYADDMLFSSKAVSRYSSSRGFERKKVEYSCFLHSERFISELGFILNVDGFKINTKKTIKSLHTISLNGYTVEGSNFSDKTGHIRISNKKTNIICKLVHKLKNKESPVLIMINLFGVDVSSIPVKYSGNRAKFIEQYCKDQINNKLAGYRSYLLSMIKFHNENSSFDQGAIDKYSKIISDIDIFLPK